MESDSLDFNLHEQFDSNFGKFKKTFHDIINKLHVPCANSKDTKGCKSAADFAAFCEVHYRVKTP